MPLLFHLTNKGTVSHYHEDKAITGRQRHAILDVPRLRMALSLIYLSISYFQLFRPKTCHFYRLYRRRQYYLQILPSLPCRYAGSG